MSEKGKTKTIRRQMTFNSIGALVETKSFRLNTRITGIFDGLRINHN